MLLPRPSIPLSLVLALTLVGCGEDVPSPAGPAESPPADLRAFFATLPAWDVFSPPLPQTEVAIGDPVEAPAQIDGAPYQCTTTPYSLTTTPEDIVTLNPDVEVLWVGSLLQGDGHLGGIGSLAELPIRQRSPLTLTLDLLSGNNTETVESPTVASVNQAIGRLIQEAHDAGHRSGSNIFYTSETAHSLDQASLKMGLSASYMGTSVKTSLSADLSSEKRTITAYFIQRMLTASMVLPQHPEDVFSDAFTQDMLDREEADGRMGPGNLPVFVSSVAYGRILMFSFTSTSTEEKIRATLNVLYNGGDFGGELDTELKSVLDNAQIRVVTVGGDAQHALDLIRQNNLGAYFTTDAPLTTARPISYTVRNLDDNAIARVSETTEYDLRQCIPAEIPVTGATYRIRITEVKAVDLSTVDYPPPLSNLGDNADGAELYYTVHLRGAHVGGDGSTTSRVVARYTPTLLYPFETRIRQNSPPYTLKMDGEATSHHELDIYFDGSNTIQVSGDLWDWDAAPNPHDRFPFSRTFRWPNATLPLDERTHTYTVDANDGHGNKLRVYFSVRKVADLVD